MKYPLQRLGHHLHRTPILFPIIATSTEHTRKISIYIHIYIWGGVYICVCVYLCKYVCMFLTDMCT